MTFKPFGAKLVKGVLKRKCMEKEQNNLERFKGKNPFTVPDGYMKDLTANIMSQLPDKPKAEAKRSP